MPEAARYAIYFVPTADSDLYRFGASVIGYDCHTGTDVPLFARAAHWPRPWSEVTRDPRKYGFHATLKAPFRLNSQSDEQRLAKALDAFAAEPREIPVIDLVVRGLGSFVALVPSRPSAALQQLAADCVSAFDGFRAPLSSADRSRRIAAGLSEAQIENLDRWGYPYVFEEFRFHMTLTGSLDKSEIAAAIALLGDAFSELVPAHTFPIDGVTLLRQDSADTSFRTLATWSLQGRAG